MAGNDNIINLYNGDMRLDMLLLEVEAVIYEMCGGRDVPTMSVIGVLENIKYKLLKDMED